MSVALITAIYGGHDNLLELPGGIECDDAVCVTDDPLLVSGTWRIVLAPRPGLHPNRAAKIPKLQPWLFTDCKSSVWIDATYLPEVWFPRWAVQYATPSGWAAHKHPGRDCIYDEAWVSMEMPKYEKEKLGAQVARYQEIGHPPHWGLWENGCTARLHTKEVRAASYSWSDEIERFSFQDQVSGPPVFRLHGLRPEIIPRRGLGYYPAPTHVASYKTPHEEITANAKLQGGHGTVEGEKEEERA